MKKILSVFMAFVMLFTMFATTSVASFAVETDVAVVSETEELGFFQQVGKFFEDIGKAIKKFFEDIGKAISDFFNSIFGTGEETPEPIVSPVITFDPAEITFNSCYEEISVKLNFENMAEDDTVKIFVNGKEYTSEIKYDSVKREEFLKDVVFAWERDDDKSTEDTYVFNIRRLTSGEGTLKVVHSRYSDISAELKIKAPELEYDKDFMEFSEKITYGKGLLVSAKNNLEAYEIVNAKVHLGLAKRVFEQAFDLLMKYSDTYKGNADYDAEVNLTEASIDRTKTAVRLIDAGNIDDAIEEIDKILN